MERKQIRYFIHDLDGNNIRIEATNKTKVDKCNTMEISRYDNTEMSGSVYLDVPVHHITSLVLSHCQLTYLPDTLFAPNLIELDLSYNRLGQVPYWIVKYNSKLQIMNLSHNQISTINSVPTCSRELRILDISNNSFSTIPFWIFSSSCSELEMLDLSENLLQTYLPVLSGRCLKKLQTLKMNNCKFKQDYLKLVREIPQLKVLSIGNISRDFYLNIIQQLPFKTFYSMTSLTELNLTGLALSVLTDDICALTSLEKLDISYNHVSWLPENFTNLTSLKILNASHNDLVSLPVDIDKLECLSELYVSYNLIGSLPDGLIKLKNLHTLDCYWNDLETDAWNKMEEMPSLQAVDLEQNAIMAIIDNKQYVEKREKLRLETHQTCRENGSKYELCDSSDDEKSLSLGFSDDSDDNDIIGTNYIHKEENWDFDKDYDSDDNLVLSPFKLVITPKKKHYDPSDFIDPVCFEDAPDDYT